MFRLLAPLLGVGLVVIWIWALIDAIRVPDDSYYSEGNKLIWVIVIVFTGFIGAIIYFIVGRPPPEYRRY